MFKRWDSDTIYLSRVVFGAEPKDYEVYDYILKNFNDLKFSKPLDINYSDKSIDKKINPKRLQRKIKKETKDNGIGTKAQIAMKQQYEDFKLKIKKVSREKKEEEKEKKFKLRQQKKLMKHRGH
ncbi:YjdF family protein [Clostridium ljungdahlii]|uniref:YjdF family protein n=1 Tax=Clostridium ljungdahlii TaxID=1538 RepID=UPI00386FAAE5